MIEKNVFACPDVTHRALLKHWAVQGPPTLILIAPYGKERRDLRMVGALCAVSILEKLNTAGTH